MKEKKNTQTRRLPDYAPEVEERRTDYRALAESLVLAESLIHSREASGRLDVIPPEWTDDEPNPHILHDAIREHMRALFDLLLDCHDDDFLRTLYVELRLYYDQQMLKFKAGPFEHRRKRGRA